MAAPLRRTPLYDLHRESGARLVEFAGWEMPIQYTGILAEHEAVRTRCGVFDVSHMAPVDFSGRDALAAVQRVTTNDASRLEVGGAQYTLLCTPEAGIVDDCIVYRLDTDRYRIVVNAANTAKDLAYFGVHAGHLCHARNRSGELALLAVQGPATVDLLGALGADLGSVARFSIAETSLLGHRLLAARTGYTGEDGFELFVAAEHAAPIWRALVGAGAVAIGLGARDTLRLEARLPLYGNDLDETTTPDEAGLQWAVKPDKGDFVGRAALLARRSAGPPARKLVGFRVTSRGIARGGTEVVDDAGAVVGRVTSGGPSPTLGGAIGLAYIPSALAQSGASLRLLQRGKPLDAELVRGPFYRPTPSRSPGDAP